MDQTYEKLGKKAYRISRVYNCCTLSVKSKSTLKYCSDTQEPAILDQLLVLIILFHVGSM